MTEQKPHRGGRSPQERQKRSRLAQLLTQEGLLRGSLTERYQQCGKPNCRCVRGYKHRTLVLVHSRGGRTHQLYVPRAWEATVRQWIENRREVERLMDELSELHWQKVRNRQA